jgi:hypothetical protein
LDSPHYTYSWRPRPEQEFIDYCNDQWKPKSEGYGHAYMTQGMKEEPLLQMRTDKMILRYVYDKPFMVTFPDRCE